MGKKKKKGRIEDPFSIILGMREKNKKSAEKEEENLNGAPSEVASKTSLDEAENKESKADNKASDSQHLPDFKEKAHKARMGLLSREIEKIPVMDIESKMIVNDLEIKTLRNKMQETQNKDEFKQAEYDLEYAVKKQELFKEKLEKSIQEHEAWMNERKEQQKNETMLNAMRDLQELREKYGEEVFKKLIA